MSLANKRKILASTIALLGALSVGCGDDSDDGDDNNGGTPDGGANLPAKVDIPATLVPITAQNDSAPITVAHNVSLIVASTGKPLDPPVTINTGTSGKVTLPIPTDQLYSVYIEGIGPANGATSTYDTYILNWNVKSGENLLRISSAGTLSNAEASAGFSAKADRAAVSGAVYFSPGGRRSGAIGCAEVLVDDETAASTQYDQRYMKTTPLPVPLADQGKTSRRGQFYFANLTTGKHTLTVKLNGAEIAKEEIFVPVTRGEAKSETKAVLYQVGIDVDVAANPTPEGQAECPPLT